MYMQQARYVHVVSRYVFTISAVFFFAAQEIKTLNAIQS